MKESRVEPVTYAETNVRKYTDSNVVVNRVVARFMEACAAHLERLTRPGDVIADVGTSEGTMTTFLARRLPDRTIVAVEYELESCLEFRKHNPAIPLSRGTAYSLPFADRSCAVVAAFEVLEHLDDPPAALREMRRVAARRVVATVPYEPYFRMANVLRGKYLARLGNTPGHINHWGPEGLKKLFRSELPAVEVRRLFPWLLATARPE